MSNEASRIESELEVRAYLQDMRYALDNGASISFMIDRKVDADRDITYTNRHTINKLFPKEDPKAALKRELKCLSVEDYLRTVKDARFPKRSEMREFGKVYNGHDEIYIKVRVELLNPKALGGHTVFVMSFHFAENHFPTNISHTKKLIRRCSMEILKKEYKLCSCCMEEHEVMIVRFPDKTVYKEEEVEFDTVCEYCERADEYFETNEMISRNDIAMKNAYRKKVGLLTSEDICAVRSKYGISQTDLALLLGWGGKTITRYESHQVQDIAHNTILKKLDSDPEWFLSLLKGAKNKLSSDSYKKYYETATQLFEREQDQYLRKAILAQYAKFHTANDCNGRITLNLDKVIDVISYFANSIRVTALYKVKLMKMLWYADALSYKRNGIAMTGLVYRALPMGAVPIAHESIIDLKGISYEEIDFGDGSGYRFTPSEHQNYSTLNKFDMEVLDKIIDTFGSATKAEIVNRMHRETAYMKTAPKEIIQFKYTKDLSIS